MRITAIVTPCHRARAFPLSRYGELLAGVGVSRDNCYLKHPLRTVPVQEYETLGEQDEGGADSRKAAHPKGHRVLGQSSQLSRRSSFLGSSYWVTSWCFSACGWCTEWSRKTRSPRRLSRLSKTSGLSRPARTRSYAIRCIPAHWCTSRRICQATRNIVPKSAGI